MHPDPQHNPRVSIGMPVRNGHRFIRQAIDSLLAQTFTDFELVICDNASTDDTEAICRDYMARDPRVRYFRNPTNIGPAGNYNRCFELSRGEFFRWHAHDDMCEPNYLQVCVDQLDCDPTTVIAYPKTLVVDDVGKPLEEYNFHPSTDSPSVSKRFGSLVLINHRQHRACEIFGLMRSSALRQTPLQGAYARGDSVMLARMALRGRFVELPQRLFLSRSHETQSMQTLPTGVKTGRSWFSRWLGTGPLPPPEWWDSSRKGKINFPEWNLLRQYWVAIGEPDLAPNERVACYRVMFEWVLRNLHKLGRDVIFAIEHVFVTLAGRIRAGISPSPTQPAERVETKAT